MRDFVLANIDWLIPEELTDGPRRRQARRAVIVALALAVWAPIFAPVFLMLGSPVGAVMIVLSFVSIVACILSLRVTRSVIITGHLLALCIVLTMVGLATRTGGTGSQSLWWLVAAPIVALVMCGGRSGLGWAIVSCIASLVFLLNDHWAIFTVESDVSDTSMRLLDAMATAGIILCAFSLTLAFKLSEDSARAEIELARRESEAANQAKSQFLAHMSHEIRTPMNAVLCLTELVLDSDLSEEQRHDLETVRDSGVSLLALINEILDFSKIEAGKIELVPTPVDLRDEMDKIEASLAPRASAKKLDFHCDVEDSVPELVMVDHLRLRQVLLNLTSNAIKFTRDGSVRVNVQCQSTSDALAHIRFVVEDTGIGIPSEKLDSIFSKFEQADASMTREFGGTGLGLAISSSLVALMGSRIDVESQVGCGSTFGFDLILDVVTDSTCVALEESRVSQPDGSIQTNGATTIGKLNILLVEDGMTNQKLARTMLEKWGHTVTTADNGKIAVDLWKKHDFDLILMDVQMPEMDGLSATQMIRKEEQTQGGHTPIVAVTAHAMKGDRERCLEAGMDAYVTKPIRQGELVAAIEALLGKTA